jgi:hypothetical protein
MSQTNPGEPNDPNRVLPYATPAGPGGSAPMLPQVGFALGIAGTLVGMFAFVVACFGYNFALAFSPLPLALGTAGLLLSIIAGIFYRNRLVDTQILASLFVSLFGIVGGLLEFAAWNHWPVLGH